MRKERCFRFLSVLTLSMILFTAACAPRKGVDASAETVSAIQDAGSASEPEAPSAPSNAEASSARPDMEPSGVASSVEAAVPQPDEATAVFSLAASGIEGKTMRIGDPIGDWTLTDLQITYFEDTDRIEMLKSVFSGQVTLKGAIVRSVLLDDAYDFQIAEEDWGKIPQYISPEATKDVTMVMLEIPEGLKNKPELEHGQKMDCNITVSSFHYIFAYMMAPSKVVLVRIDELPEADAEPVVE